MKVARIQINGASGQKSHVIGGLLAKLRVLPTNPGASLDVTIKADGDTLVTLTGINSNQTLYPQVAHTDSSGDPLDTTSYPPVNSLSVTLANAEANTTLVVEAYYFE